MAPSVSGARARPMCPPGKWPPARWASGSARRSGPRAARRWSFSEGGAQDGEARSRRPATCASPARLGHPRPPRRRGHSQPAARARHRGDRGAAAGGPPTRRRPQPRRRRGPRLHQRQRGRRFHRALVRAVAQGLRGRRRHRRGRPRGAFRQRSLGGGRRRRACPRAHHPKARAGRRHPLSVGRRAGAGSRRRAGGGRHRSAPDPALRDGGNAALRRRDRPAARDRGGAVALGQGRAGAGRVPRNPSGAAPGRLLPFAPDSPAAGPRRARGRGQRGPAKRGVADGAPRAARRVGAQRAPIAPRARLVHFCTPTMSAAPDPAELAPSRDPAAYGRRPLFTPRFFAWAGVCAACLIAGALVGRFGFAPANPAAESEPALEAPTHAPANTAPLTPSLATLGAPINAATAPVVASADVSALSSRVARLEGGAAGLDASAAEALAAASLSDAAAGSAPFDQDLAAYERVAPPSPELRALEPLAARGAPSRAELAAAFPALASEAAAAARTPRKGASLLDRLVAALGKVVIVRNIDPSAGGVDGLLARAEHAALAGDLAAALRDID